MGNKSEEEDSDVEEEKLKKNAREIIDKHLHM